MFARHKTAILRVTDLLRRLAASREDLALLVAIQGELVRRSPHISNWRSSGGALAMASRSPTWTSSR
jgi:hypothetical protein